MQMPKWSLVLKKNLKFRSFTDRLHFFCRRERGKLSNQALIYTRRPYKILKNYKIATYREHDGLIDRLALAIDYSNNFSLIYIAFPWKYFPSMGVSFVFVFLSRWRQA